MHSKLNATTPTGAVIIFAILANVSGGAFEPSLSSSSSSSLSTTTSLQQKQQQDVKLLCWVLSIDTTENNLKSNAIEDTWGARCDKLLIVKNGTTSQRGEGGPRGGRGGDLVMMGPSSTTTTTTTTVITLHLEHSEGREQLWRKVVATLRVIASRYLEHYDWFFKADDDTYLRVDALKEFLIKQQQQTTTTGSNKNNDNYGETRAAYFGHRFRPYVSQGYMSGGSGYVLSRAALRRLVEFGFANRLAPCQLDTGQVEDVILGRCLEACGVRAGDTRDPQGRETFLPLSPESLLNDHIEPDHWYRTYAYYPRIVSGSSSSSSSDELDCCSDRPISFHYINPREMRLIDWLLYRVKK